MAVDTTFTYAGIDYTLSVGASGRWQIDDQVDLDGVEIYGDVTESGVTGTMAATGIVTLTGTADQTWNTATDVSGLTVASTKTDGDVTLSSSIAIDASGFYCDNLTIDQTLTLSGTGTVHLSGLLTISAGTTTLNVDVYCCGYDLAIGATRQGTGTIYYDTCGITIGGTDNGLLVDLAARRRKRGRTAAMLYLEDDE